MTEDEWSSLDLSESVEACCNLPVSLRKWRLFTIACFRQIPSAAKDPRSIESISVAERFADGLADDRELATAHALNEQARLCLEPCPDPRFWSADCAYTACTEECRLSCWQVLAAADSAADASSAIHTAAANPVDYHLRGSIREWQLAAFRDIFAGPFLSIRVDPDWVTSVVLNLARSIYDTRSFDRLPALADILKQTGCDGEAILGHCRGPGPHVRGCWVVDLILGKK